MRALLLKEKQMASGQFGIIMHTMLHCFVFCPNKEGKTAVGNTQLKVSNYGRGF